MPDRQPTRRRVQAVLVFAVVAALTGGGAAAAAADRLPSAAVALLADPPTGARLRAAGATLTRPADLPRPEVVPMRLPRGPGTLIGGGPDPGWSWPPPPGPRDDEDHDRQLARELNDANGNADWAATVARRWDQAVQALKLLPPGLRPRPSDWASGRAQAARVRASEAREAAAAVRQRLTSRIGHVIADLGVDMRRVKASRSEVETTADPEAWASFRADLDRVRRHTRQARSVAESFAVTSDTEVWASLDQLSAAVDAARSELSENIARLIDAAQREQDPSHVAWLLGEANDVLAQAQPEQVSFAQDNIRALERRLVTLASAALDQLAGDPDVPAPILTTWVPAMRGKLRTASDAIDAPFPEDGSQARDTGMDRVLTIAGNARHYLDEAAEARARNATAESAPARPRLHVLGPPPAELRSALAEAHAGRDPARRVPELQGSIIKAAIGLARRVAWDGFLRPADQEWGEQAAARLRKALDEADAAALHAQRAIALDRACSDAILVIGRARNLLIEAQTFPARPDGGRTVTELGVTAAELDPARLSARLEQLEAAVANAKGAAEQAELRDQLWREQARVIHHAATLARMVEADHTPAHTPAELTQWTWGRMMDVRMRMLPADADELDEAGPSKLRAGKTRLALQIIADAPAMITWADGGPVWSEPPAAPEAAAPEAAGTSEPGSRWPGTSPVDLHTALLTSDLIRGHISPEPAPIDRGALRVLLEQRAGLLWLVQGSPDVGQAAQVAAGAAAARLRSGLDNLPADLTDHHDQQLALLLDSSERAVADVKQSLGMPAGEPLAAPAAAPQPEITARGDDDDPPPSAGLQQEATTPVIPGSGGEPPPAAPARLAPANLAPANLAAANLVPLGYAAGGVVAQPVVPPAPAERVTVPPPAAEPGGNSLVGNSLVGNSLVGTTLVGNTLELFGAGLDGARAPTPPAPAPAPPAPLGPVVRGPVQVLGNLGLATP